MPLPQLFSYRLSQPNLPSASTFLTSHGTPSSVISPSTRIEFITVPIDIMARGNQRELARAKNLKKQADQVSPLPLLLPLRPDQASLAADQHREEPLGRLLGLCLARAPTS